MSIVYVLLLVALVAYVTFTAGLILGTVLSRMIEAGQTWAEAVPFESADWWERLECLAMLAVALFMPTFIIRNMLEEAAHVRRQHAERFLEDVHSRPRSGADL